MMNEQALRQLLIDADAAAGAVPATSGDLVSAVQHRLRRRRQSHVAGASIVLCAIFVIVPFIRMSPKLPAVADQSKTRGELSMIRLQANSQAATVNRLMQYQQSLDMRV